MSPRRRNRLFLPPTHPPPPPSLVRSSLPTLFSKMTILGGVCLCFGFFFLVFFFFWGYFFFFFSFFFLFSFGCFGRLQGPSSFIRVSLDQLIQRYEKNPPLFFSPLPMTPEPSEILRNLFFRTRETSSHRGFRCDAPLSPSLFWFELLSIFPLMDDGASRGASYLFKHSFLFQGKFSPRDPLA